MGFEWTAQKGPALDAEVSHWRQDRISVLAEPPRRSRRCANGSTNVATRTRRIVSVWVPVLCEQCTSGNMCEEHNWVRVSLMLELYGLARSGTALGDLGATATLFSTAWGNEFLRKLQRSLWSSTAACTTAFAGPFSPSCKSSQRAGVNQQAERVQARPSGPGQRDHRARPWRCRLTLEEGSVHARILRSRDASFGGAVELGMVRRGSCHELELDA